MLFNPSKKSYIFFKRTMCSLILWTMTRCHLMKSSSKIKKNKIKRLPNPQFNGKKKWNKRITWRNIRVLCPLPISPCNGHAKPTVEILRQLNCHKSPPRPNLQAWDILEVRFSFRTLPVYSMAGYRFVWEQRNRNYYGWRYNFNVNLNENKDAALTNRSIENEKRRIVPLDLWSGAFMRSRDIFYRKLPT